MVFPRTFCFVSYHLNANGFLLVRPSNRTEVFTSGKYVFMNDVCCANNPSRARSLHKSFLAFNPEDCITARLLGSGTLAMPKLPSEGRSRPADALKQEK